MCDCNSVCSAQCARVCITVGGVANAYGTPDVASGAKATVSVFTKIADAINAFRTRFSYSAATISVTDAAKILASDWNAKIRDNANGVTWANNVSPYTVNQTLGVPTAVADTTKITATGFKPNDIITLLNSKYCTTVCVSNCRTVVVCDCQSYIPCSCEGYTPCGCDGYTSCNCGCDGYDPSPCGCDGYGDGCDGF